MLNVLRACNSDIRDFKMLGRRRRLKRDINFSIWEKLQWIDTWSLFNEFNNDLVLRKQL